MKNVLRFIRKIVSSINPVLANKIMYKKLMHKELNLKNPETFNEKINWLKLYEYPSNEKIIKASDKFRVREYLHSINCDRYLNELYGVWDRVEDIEWDKLPNKFVLKCNHGSGYNILCLNKKELDRKSVEKKLNKWMHEDFGKVSAEPHYSSIPRKIICEKYLTEDIIDYKFYCFNGEPKFFYVSIIPNGDFHYMKAIFYNIDGTKANFIRTDHEILESVVLPSNLNEMVELSRHLSKEFKFVRVDLFNVDGKIYFSELTFSPCSGFMPLSPSNADYEIGELISLDKGDVK